MPYKQKRSCPVCGKRDLKIIHTHLRNVHKFDREQRKPLLKEAKHSSWLTEYGPEYAQEIPAASTSTGNVVRKKSRKLVKASYCINMTTAIFVYATYIQYMYVHADKHNTIRKSLFPNSLHKSN